MIIETVVTTHYNTNKALKQFWVAVDFDGVIHDPSIKGEIERMGAPMRGAVEALTVMKHRGWYVSIFTVRGASPKHVEDWLQHYHIPFDEVTNIKKNFDLMIDDRAVKFEGWDVKYF